MKERVKFINFNQAIEKVDFLSDEVKSRDIVRWAYQIVRTRSFEAEGDERIVPMADMVRMCVCCNVDVELVLCVGL